jgi:hypothetical protein
MIAALWDAPWRAERLLKQHRLFPEKVHNTAAWRT